MARNNYQISDDTAARLRELQQVAGQLKGSTPKSSPVWEAARDLASIMNNERVQGATFKDIGNAAGVSWSAVRFRLGRWGYVDLPPSAKNTAIKSGKDE